MERPVHLNMDDERSEVKMSARKNRTTEFRPTKIGRPKVGPKKLDDRGSARKNIQPKVGQ